MPRDIQNQLATFPPVHTLDLGNCRYLAFSPAVSDYPLRRIRDLRLARVAEAEIGPQNGVYAAIVMLPSL